MDAILSDLDIGVEDEMEVDDRPLSSILPPSPIDILYGAKGPTDKQIIFRDAPEKYKLFGGGLGGGKSWALCAEALRFTLMYAGNYGFLCRSEASAFKKSTLKHLMSNIAYLEKMSKDQGGPKLLVKHHVQDMVLTFFNGSVILYGGLGTTVEDQEKIKSTEFGWFAVDEAADLNAEIARMLKGRLRLVLPDGTRPRYFGLFASNPAPGWLKDDFVTPQIEGYPNEDHLFIPSLVKDNPYLPPGYLEELVRDNPKSWVKRFVNGSWDAVEGQIWPEFDRNVHVYPNENSDAVIELPDEFHLIKSIGGLDHGRVNPTCFLGAYTDGDDNIFIYDEYYAKGIISDHCDAIHQQFNIESFEYIDADPSMSARNQDKNGELWSNIDEYAEYGISLSQGNNQVEAGINRVAEYFRVRKDHINPLTGEKGSPRVFISSRCKNLIRELGEYIWEKSADTRNDPKERPRKKNDHACDTIRYLIMSRPSPFAVEIDTEAKVGTFDYYYERMKVKRERAGRARFV